MSRSDRSLRVQARPTVGARRAIDAGQGSGSVRVAYRPRKRRGSFKRTLLLVLAVALGSVIVAGALLWSRVAAFNAQVSTAPAASTSLILPLNFGDRVNVAMLGYGGEAGEQHGGSYLADSINILSIDTQTDTTTVIPIPRDLWVEGISQLPNNGKVNEVFAAGYETGGIQQAGAASAEVLAAVTGLEIDHWMAIDFAGFQEMVDAVGGVTIENPTAFDYTWDENFYNQGIWDAGSFASGILTLDGRGALDYARTRYTSQPSESSDYARSVRQQRIMSALKEKVGEGGLSSIGPSLGLMDALANRLDTDLSAIDLFLLSSHLDADRRIELSEDVILQAAFNDIGQYVLVVIGRSTPNDYGPLHSYLADELARPIETEAPAATGP